VEAWGWGGSFVTGSWRFGRRRGLGWVVETRVWVREELNSPESGQTPKLWVGARDGGWGGDDVGYCVFVVLRFEIFMFKC
jgi:hypothetical protein